MSLPALLFGLCLGAAAFLLTGLRPAVRLVLAAGIALLAGVALPALAHRARARAEAPVIANLYLVALKEHTFRTALIQDRDGDGRGEYGTLKQLYRTRPPLIHDALQAGTEFGYRFYVILGKSVDGTEERFYAFAVPIAYGVTGRRAMYVDETTVVRIADIGPEVLVTREGGARWAPAPLPADA